MSKIYKVWDFKIAEITKKEFLELLQEFSEKTLDPKFKKIDDRFEKIDSRFEKIDERFDKVDSKFVEFKEDIIHQFHVISEDVISKIQLVAEGGPPLMKNLIAV